MLNWLGTIIRETLGVILVVVLAVVLAVILAAIGLVVAWQMYLASSPEWQIGVGLVVVVVAGAVAALLLLSFAPDRDTREPREQDPAPKYPRYDPSIRVFIVFFAAVLGFGLKRLLDRGEPSYKWLFFLVATFIFLRFLTAAQNNLWLRYLKYERAYSRLDDFYVGVGFFWITVFGILGAYLCYADTPPEFFRRACILLSVTLLGSGLQWLWSFRRRSDPKGAKGEWGWWFSLVNGTQLTAVVGFWGIGVWWGWTWGLVLLAVANFLILVADFLWQLKQVAK